MYGRWHEAHSMWLCSRHHRPSLELLRLAKPKPSPRNVNPPPLPFPSLPRPLGTPIPLSLPTGGTTQAPPVSGRPLGTRRLSSGVCLACLTQQNAPRAPRVPWRVSTATAEGHSAARTERTLFLVGSPARTCGAAFAHAPALGTNAARTWASESLLRTPCSSRHKPGGETAGSHGPSAV